MVTYTKGQPGQLKEIRDFINMVFSMNRAPHDFKSLLPKLYGDKSSTEPFHYLVMEDNHIQAVVCVLPITISCGSRSLSCGTVGSVSVHPYQRGKGYMKQLMAMAMEDMKKQSMAISVLSGRRHRYGYYGYELAGNFLDYELIQDNFQHTKGKYTEYPIQMEPVHPLDSQTLTELWTMYQQSRSIHGDRTPENFYDICTSWHSQFCHFLCNGQSIGYACFSQNQVEELVCLDETYLYSCLQACFQAIGAEQIHLRVCGWDARRIHALSGLYERWNSYTDDNYLILDHQKALDFFLKAKASFQHLLPGSLVLEVKEGVRLKITVPDSDQEAGIAICPSQEKPDRVFSSSEAISQLFSPAAFYQTGQGMPSPEKSPLFQNWFPLPLCLSPLDKC